MKPITWSTLVICICLFCRGIQGRPANIPETAVKDENGSWTAEEIIGPDQVRILVWNSDGIKIHEGDFIRSRRILNGNVRRWSNSGKLLYSVSFANGKKEGVETEWLTDGTQSITYKDGRRVGNFSVESTGKWLATGHFKDDEPYGPVFVKFSDGRIDMGFYDPKMQRDGEWCTYDNKGHLIHLEYFHQGKSIDQISDFTKNKTNCIRDEYFQDYLAGHSRYKTYEEYETVLMQKSQPAKEKWLKERREQEKKAAGALLKKTGG